MTVLMSRPASDRMELRAEPPGPADGVLLAVACRAWGTDVWACKRLDDQRRVEWREGELAARVWLATVAETASNPKETS